MDKRVYVLLKGLPDAKAGDEYILRGDMYRPLTAEQSSSPVIEVNSYFRWQVEGNDTWFKLKEQPKEWEITCFLSSLGKYCKLGYNNLYSYDTHGGWSLDVMLRNHTIYSVKRMSDGEVFTIGDRVGYDDGNSRTKEDWAIDNFFIRETDNVMLARSKDNINVELVDKWLYKNNPKKEQPVQDTFQWDDTNWEGIAIRLSGTKDHKEAAIYLMNQMNIIVRGKQSKSTPKEDKVEVGEFHATRDANRPGKWYSFLSSEEILNEKYPSIKKAIEEVLNKK
jgi:hypothetical protein